MRKELKSLKRHARTRRGAGGKRGIGASEALRSGSPRSGPASNLLLNDPAAELRRLRAQLEFEQREFKLQNRELLDLQRELEVSQHRYAELYDRAPVGYLTHDVAGNVHEANLTAAEILGVTRARIVGFGLFSFLPREDHRKWLNYLRHCRREFGPITVELGWQVPGRGRQTLLVTGQRLWKEADQRPLFAMVVEDVTARKLAEESLRESERRFRVLADSAPVMIWMAGADQGSEYFNARWLEFTGRQLEEEVKRGWLDGVHPEDRRRCIETHDAAFEARREFEMEYRLRRHDGEYRWILDHGVPRFRGDEYAGYIGTCIDITERKEWVAALQESEERFRTLASHAPVGIFLSNTKGEAVYVNECWCKIAGLSAADALGHGWQRAIHPDDAERIQSGWAAAVRKREESSAEFRFLRPNQTVAWVYGSTIRLRDAAGEFVGYIGTVVDITERRETEERLRNKETQLRIITDITPLMLARCGRDLRYLFANRAYAEMLGRSPEQIIGRPVLKIMGARAYRKVLPYIQRVLKGERVEFEEEVRFRGAGVRALHVVYLPETDEHGTVQGWVASINDVTYRRHIERRVTWLASFPENNPNPIVELDLKRRVLHYANPYATRLFPNLETRGLRHPLFKGLKEAAGPLLSGRARVVRREVQVGKIWIAQSLSYVPEVGHLRIYGTEITEQKRVEALLRKAHEQLETRVQQRTAALTRANQQLEAMIAQRRLAEQSLRESEERLRLVVEGVRDYAIYLLDPEGRVASWNAGAERIKGYTAKEILGRHFSRFFPPEAVRAGRPQQLLRLAKRQGHVEEESWRVRKDGTRFLASATMTALRDEQGRLRGFSKVTRDITERKRAEDALRENEQNLEDFFAQAPLGLLWVSASGHVERVNRAMLDLLGRPLPEGRGQHVTEFFLDPKGAMDALRALARGEALQNYRSRLVRPDGTTRHVLIDANGLWRKGKFQLSRWFVRDITHRVELEQEIIGISEREQQRIGHDLHDDLCQQLSGIEFLSQTLAGQLGANGRPEATRASEIAGMIRKTIEHTRELAHGLSPVRLEEDGLMIALRELADRTEKLFHITCNFRCRVPVLVSGESVGIHLYRIAQEAVSNAIKHGKARHIDITLIARFDEIVLEVSDNGIGFPAKLRKKGMGLRVMRYRSNILGGTLAVRRHVHGGTSVVCIIKPSFHPPDLPQNK